MPLLLAEMNKENIIQKVGGTPDIKHHLENLGFVAGSTIQVVNKSNGNIIVSIKDTRIAISQELARKIIV